MAGPARYDNRSVSLGSTSLGYRIGGEGERRLVLLHGLNSHSGTWRKCFDRLARDATVVAPSLPPSSGSGTSELADRYADQVLAVCEDAGIGRAAFVGSSMGGWVAMRLVSRQGRLVSRLVLEDTAGGASADADAVERSGRPVLIVWGESDPVLTLASGRTLHSKLTRSELRVIPGAGHVPHWEAPDEFLMAVDGFLRA